ncbi:MAG: hypothetical protein H5T86_09950 [Armatimonadetes bacterium]|nr:hypothetical protein [Armatimonadota bacterium]
MALVRPCAELIVDNAHADGLLEKHGFAYDWRFDAAKDLVPGIADDFRASWIGDGCEIVPVLRALGLRGYAVKDDMRLEDWSVEAGDCWKVVTPDGRPRVAYLFWCDARPNRHGIVMSRQRYEPRIALWLWRFAPPAGQTEPVFIEVTLHGDGAGPAYTVQLPLHDEAHKYPRLWRHDPNQPEAYLVDELQRYDAARLAMLGGALEQHLWIEETDGVLVMSVSGVAEPWVYQPEDGQGPSRGHVSVTVRGHCAMFNLQPITYPAQGTARPARFIFVPDWMNRTPSYLPVTGGSGEVEVGEDEQASGGWTRPVVTLRTADPHRRPVVYLLHQYHQAQFGSGQSSPQSTAGRSVLLRLSWRRRMWRGWRFKAELRDFSGTCAWRGNEKVCVKAGWGAPVTQVMVGYLTGPRRERHGEEFLGRSTLEVEGKDYIGARLAGKKFMAWHGSPVGWNFAQWFRYVLNRAGVPDALITVEDDGYVIGAMPDKWLGRYEFGHDVEVVRALDAVVRARGWVWGVNPEGQIWAGPEPQYGGFPDFILDDDTVTEEDRVLRVSAERAGDEFRNYVAVFSGRRAVEAAIWHDEGSHRDPASDAFIADDWWRVLVEPDEPDPTTLAWQVFCDAQRWRADIVWETPGKPQLRPGMFVRVDASGLGVAEGSVFQIVEDIGIMEPERGLFRSVFYARAVDR